MKINEEIKSTGIIVVDVQGDFTTAKNGTLAVNNSDKTYIEKIGNITKFLKNKGYNIYATMDWHPQNHVSFFSSYPGKKALDVITVEDRTQVLWPSHCVQNTEGAKLLIDKSLCNKIIKKGKNKNFDSYSGFKDDGGAQTGLKEILKKDGIINLIIYGLALDFCVKATAIDAVREGFTVTVITNLSPFIDPASAATAIKEMKNNHISIEETISLD